MDNRVSSSVTLISLAVLLVTITVAVAQDRRDPCNCVNGICVLLGGRDSACVCDAGFTGEYCGTADTTGSVVTEAIDPSFGVDVVRENCGDASANEGNWYVVTTSAAGGESSAPPPGPSRNRRTTTTPTYNVTDMCRLLLPPQVNNENYNISIDLLGSPDRNASVYPLGLLYNAMDENNYDFILVNTVDDPAMQNDEFPCYVTGYYEGGEAYVSQAVDCDGDKQQAGVDSVVQIDASVMKTAQSQTASFQVHLSGSESYIFTATPHFPVHGRVGLVAVNEISMVVQASNMFIKYVSQSPQLTGVFPTYGPQAGSTIITLSGIALPNADTVVRVGARNFQTLSIGVDKVTAMSPPFAEPTDGMSTDVDDTPAADLQIQLFYPEKGIRLVAEETFRYLPDPVITDFYPKDTIVGGGVAVYVSGESLTSVAVHVMKVTMVYKKRYQEDQPYFVFKTQTFTSTCTVLNATLMTCPTPSIVLPPPFSDLTISSVQPTRRKRRGTVEETLHGRWERQEETLHGRWKRQEETLHGRWKRQKDDDDSLVVISDTEISNEKLEFYVSIKSDGIESFNEQTNDTAITVFANPVFYKFSQEIIKYNPNRDPAISIKGERLTVGARIEDYRVTIGVGECSDIDLAINELACLPPGREPDTNVTALGASHVEGAPGVTVHVGNFQLIIGHLDYTGVRTTSAAAAAFLANSFFCLPAVMWTLLLLL